MVQIEKGLQFHWETKAYLLPENIEFSFSFYEFISRILLTATNSPHAHFHFHYHM
jgi:hypothetical protein